MAKPIYQLIIDELTKEIEGLAANTPIISERELAVRFNASRMTVRKAINILVDTGYLYRDKNKGTFVADKKMHKTNTAISNRECDENINYKVVYFDIKKELEEKDIIEKLNINFDDPVARVVRVNLKDNIPQDVEEIYIPRKIMENQHTVDLNKILDFSHFINDGSVTQKFIPMKVPLKYMHFLELKIGTPIIMIESLIRDKTGKPLVYIKTFNNPNEKEILIIS